MMGMPRRLMIRGFALMLGAAPLAILLHVIDASPGLGGIAVILYAALGGIYFANYGVEHEDELPTRLARREHRRRRSRSS